MLVRGEKESLAQQKLDLRPLRANYYHPIMNTCLQLPLQSCLYGRQPPLLRHYLILNQAKNLQRFHDLLARTSRTPINLTI